MLSDFNYKKKNRLLAIGAVVLLFLSWQLAFAKTFSLWAQCRDMEEQLQAVSEAPGQSLAMKERLLRLDRTLGGREISDTNIRQVLLGIVTGYCQKNNTILRDFPKPVSTIENDYMVETNIISVEGSFGKLLDLVYRLEQRDRIGKIASVDFHTRQDPRTKVMSLVATVYIQNVKKINHE